MQASNVTHEQIEKAAVASDVRVWWNPRNPSRFTLKTLRTGADMRWRRIGYRGRTVPGRVCWHGHRAFMRALFALAPDAVLVTAMATYRGAAHFEATHGATRIAERSFGAARRGSGFAPRVSLDSDECDCLESPALDSVGRCFCDSPKQSCGLHASMRATA